MFNSVIMAFLLTCIATVFLLLAKYFSLTNNTNAVHKFKEL